MTLAATYTDAAGLVQLVASSAPSNANTALFERSTDQVTWTQVRGGQAVIVSAGGASIKDYEYAAGVPNFYRVSYVSTVVPAWVTGADISGHTASAVPATTTISLSGLTVATGDLVTIVVSLSVAPTSGTLTCTTAGWTIARVGTLGAVLTARWSATLAAPVVGVTVAGTTALSWYGFRYKNAVLAAMTSQVNATAVSIAFPAAPAQPPTGVTTVLLEARAGTFTAPATPSGDFVDGTKGIVARHNGAWTTAGTTTFSAGATSTSFIWGGWVAQASYIARDTVTVTPAQTGVWLKNPLRPFLNRVVTVIDFDDLTRASRSGVFDVIGRTDQVAVTDLMSGRSTSLLLRTTDRADADDLDTMIAVGEVLLLQPPYQAAPPTFYFVPGNPARSRVAQTSAVRRFTVPATEVAQPDPTLAAVQSTWQTVVNTYATWADLIAAKATWSDVLQIVGSASDVVTS